MLSVSSIFMHVWFLKQINTIIQINFMFAILHENKLLIQHGIMVNNWQIAGTFEFYIW